MPTSYFSEIYKNDLKKLFEKILVYRKSYHVIGKKPKRKYDYFFLPNTITYERDVQDQIRKLRKVCNGHTKIVVTYFNYLWKPFLDFATFIKIRKKDRKEPNWFTPDDVSGIFKLEGFEEIKRGKRLLFPIYLGPISDLINNLVAQLPGINSLCLTNYQIFKPSSKIKEYSVSIIVPARNEEKNIRGILKKIPKIGSSTEIIFVEGHSKDNTYKALEAEIIRHKKSDKKALLFKQTGIGKADAVNLGFEKATGEVLIILDADLTVDPRDLNKFYDAIKNGHAEFVNGSRLVYPLEKDSMRSLNYIFNKIFSILFTYILGQKIKDTLCGTKALFKSDYKAIKSLGVKFKELDPFGDFDLLLGATLLNLKIAEVPVRYKARVFGKTNIKRFSHGWMLLKMTYLAAKLMKFT